MSIKKQIRVNIKAEFGSASQHEFANDSLINLLEGWRVFLHTSHKNNVVEFEIKEEQ